MKKLMLIAFVTLILSITLTSCQANKEQQADNTEKSALSQMQEYHVENIGDNSNVGKLLSFLPQFDKNYVQNMFALQTDNEPYGLTIYYEPTENVNGVDMDKTEEMTTYAGYLFDSIDNLGYVEYAFRTTPSGDELEQSEYSVLLKVNRPQ